MNADGTISAHPDESMVLNATRGFVVVADEMRKLADNSSRIASAAKLAVTATIVIKL